MATVIESLQSIASNNSISDVNSLEFATLMDNNDELKSFRNNFLFPKAPEGKTCSYLCGNSLGLQPATLRVEVDKYLTKWAEQGVEGHHEGDDCWIEGEYVLRSTMAKMVGALESEVIFMNSLTANLHFMMVSFYRPTATRFKILMEKKAFPSDYHAIISQIQLHGFDVESALIEVGPREGETLIRLEDIEAAITAEGDSIALILFSGIQYYTGQLFDMKQITAWGKAKGCNVGFDLAHAVGNVPMQLHDWGCDFACWCTYKYLNSGPGCMAGCFVHEQHGKTSFDPNTLSSKYPTPVPLRLAGWWGHRGSDRFVMEPTFVPEEGAPGFRVSNPPMVCVACIKASLELFNQAGMERLRAKSILMTGYLEYLLKRELTSHVTILTPSDPAQRGCQLSLTFHNPASTDSTVTPEQILAVLKEEGVFGDVRKPNVIRIAPTPLYNSFQDVFHFVAILKRVLLK